MKYDNLLVSQSCSFFGFSSEQYYLDVKNGEIMRQIGDKKVG